MKIKKFFKIRKKIGCSRDPEKNLVIKRSINGILGCFQLYIIKVIQKIGAGAEMFWFLLFMENTRRFSMREEENYCQEVEKLKRFVMRDNQESFQECITEVIDKVQRGAFMSGYEYAITILEESKVEKK